MQELKLQLNRSMRRRRTKQAGMSLVTVMFFIGGISLIAISGLALATMGNRMAFRSESKIASNTLAESGINHLYDEVRRQMQASNTYPESVSGSLGTDLDGGGTPVGTYTAVVENMTTKEVSTGMGVQTEWTFIVRGTGRAANGAESVVTARFTAIGAAGTSQVDAPADPFGLFMFSPGAVQSNGPIEFRSDEGFNAKDPNNSKYPSAHIVSNAGITWSTVSKAKTDISSSSFFTVEGMIMAPNMPTATPYDVTIAKTGMNNPNGKINYSTTSYNGTQAYLAGSNLGRLVEYFEELALSTANMKLLGDVATTTTTMLADASSGKVKSSGSELTAIPKKWYMPTKSQVDTWEGQWFARVHAADSTQICGDLNSSEYTPDKNGVVTIKTPLVVHGNINIQAGTKVKFLGTSAIEADNVIYTTGDITNEGSIVNAGVTLVSNGRYSDTPTSKYSVQLSFDAGDPRSVRLKKAILPENDDPSVDARRKMLNASSLVSLLQDKEAIRMASSQNSAIGLVYAARGGIAVTSSDAVFNGSFISGPNDAYGGIRIAPRKGGKLEIQYEQDCLGPKAAFMLSKTTEAVTIESCESFTPSKLFGWNRSK